MVVVMEQMSKIALYAVSGDKKFNLINSIFIISRMSGNYFTINTPRPTANKYENPQKSNRMVPISKEFRLSALINFVYLNV